MDKYKEIINNVIGQLNIPADSQSSFDIRLILTEAFTNAFKHGNKSCTQKPIYFSYEYNGVSVRFEIQDSGSGFENEIIPVRVSDESMLEDCGRGLFLINAVADKIDIRDNIMIIEKVL